MTALVPNRNETEKLGRLSQIPVVAEFLKERRAFLDQLTALRHRPDEFDAPRTRERAAALGRLEIEAALIEYVTWLESRR